MALLASLTAGAASVQATTCPVPDGFAFQGGDLPATVAALGKRNLTVLALGGASTLGGPAHGAAFTYPARLEARLREALPGTITVVVQAVPREVDADLVAGLDDVLASRKPALVIWGPGGSAAARGEDLDTFIGTVGDVIGKVRAAGADLILMTLQYAPSVSRVINLYPYRMAIIRAGEDAGVAVLDRYQLMQFWNDNGFLNLDATDADERIQVSRALYECMAELLANAVVDAAK